MTPEERAVIDAAIYLRYCIDAKTAGDPPRIGRLLDFVDALIYSCPQCNAGGHTCPGDGNPIGHTATDCGEHEDDKPMPRLDVPGATIMHSMCTDPCSPECPPAPEWTPATLKDCLAGDRIRIGADETDVLSCSLGAWHADTRDMYRPVGWEHQELRMELAAVPGVQQYPPNAYCEILATPERKAILTLQMTFPGSAVISSDVD